MWLSGKVFQWILETKTKKCSFSLKLLFSSLLLTAVGFYSAAQSGTDWVLAAEKFKFSQTKVDQAVTATAESIPSLILEQMAENLVRMPRAQEALDKELYDLRKARLSLFLQISKEEKTRNAYFLNSYSNRRLRSKIKAHEKTMKSLKKQIDENLAAEKEAVKKYSPEIAREKEREKRIEEGQVIHAEDQKEDLLALMKDIFRKEPAGGRSVKNVTFYKNDVTQLFSPGKDNESKDYSSYEFEKACVDAGITGLLTGQITIYGSYVSVSASIYSFPGAKLIGSATEVGVIDDLKMISLSIARMLTPKIADSMPIELEFEIEPPEIKKDLIITVDDLVYRNLSTNLISQSGVHQIMFSAPGYNEISTSYSFVGNRKFHIKAHMTKTDNGSANLWFKKVMYGDVFANGNFSGKLDDENQVSQITVDGHEVLGHFIDVNGQSADFIISSRLMREDANLMLNVKTFDRSKYIENRRRWMYTSYSVLICSLIPAFYCYGNSYAASRAYNSNASSAASSLFSGSSSSSNYNISYEDAKNWQTASNITIGISCICGAWFVYELVRYLQSANTVLPAKAKKVSDKKLVKIKTKEEKRLEAVRLKKAQESESAEASESAEFEEVLPESEVGNSQQNKKNEVKKDG